MNQSELDRAICRATGESRELIQRIGFKLVVPPKPRKRRRRRGIIRLADFHLVKPVPQPA